MRVVLAIVGISLLAASCVTNTTPSDGTEHPGTPEQRELGRQLVLCVARNQASFDNGRSDAETVGKALIDGPCYKDNLRLSESLARDLDPQARRELMRRPQSFEYELATRTVRRKRGETIE